MRREFVWRRAAQNYQQLLHDCHDARLLAAMRVVENRLAVLSLKGIAQKPRFSRIFDGSLPPQSDFGRSGR
jgi:hypothetical protein